MTLLSYCKSIVAESQGNKEALAEILMAGVESESPDERELVWSLMRQAGSPFYTRQSFYEAAQLALDIVNGDDYEPTPPRAA